MMLDYFRFLDLPYEIRELVYDELLCTWEMKHNQERACLITRHDSPTSILRTSKQLYNESYDYLVRHNRFIHLNCNSVSIRLHPLGRHILPVSADPKTINAFKGYIARVNWSMSNDSSNTRSQKQYMVLSHHWNSILKCTDYHGMIGWPDITMSITLDPIPTTFSQTDTKPPPLRPFQTALLKPLPSFLHSFLNLSIHGPVPDSLSKPIIAAVAQPRWSRPSTALTDLKWCTQNINATHPCAYYPSTTAILECGIQTIDHMRASPAWPRLVREGGAPFLGAIAEMSFEFLLRRAECALGAMERGPRRRTRVVEFGEQADADLKECVKARGAEGWVPSGEQVAVVMCLVARRWRLLSEGERRDGAVDLVERAVEMCPGNGMVREEREAVGKWSRDVDRYYEEVGMGANGSVMSMWQWGERKKLFGC